MGSEADCEATPTPKLSLYSFPSNKAKEPSGMITPPIHTSVSIPFQWEEAPGKPRPYRGGQSESKPNAARCLELPPRLLAEAKIAPSPTTVLDGPDHAGRFVSYTSSFLKGGSFRRPDNKRVINKEKVTFGSSRWGSFRKAGRVVQGSFDFSTPVVDGGGDAGASDGAAEVNITRVRRKGSFPSLSQASSHVLASIYESFKQVVPWRRRHEKMKRKGSSTHSR